MKATKMTKLGLVLGMAVITQAAQAVSVSVVAPDYTPGVGDTFQVNLVVSGLDDLGPTPPNNEIISAFDFGLGFDGAIIQANSITIAGLTTTFGDSWLGDGNPISANPSIRDSVFNFDFANAKDGETYIGPGYSKAVRLSEASFLAAGTLQAGQPGSFILGSIEFEAIGKGTSALGVIDDSLYDGSAGVLDIKGLDGVTPLALTTVQDNITVVPVPAAVWLFGSAIFGMAGFSRKKMAKAI